MIAKKLLVIIISLIIVACAAPGTGVIPEKGKAIEQVRPKVDPKAATAYASALASMAAGKTSRAEDQFQKIIKDYPEFSGPHTNLGIMYFRAEKIEQAKTSFANALKLNPNSVVSLNHMGIISRGEGKFKEAHSYYTRALQADPDYGYAHLNIGILLELYMGKLPEALEHYKRYQELNKKEDKKVKGWIIDLERRVKN